MKEKCDKGLEAGMRVWEETGSYFRKACLKLFFPPQSIKMHLIQEASDSKFKALAVYKRLYMPPHCTGANPENQLILPFYRRRN